MLNTETVVSVAFICICVVIWAFLTREEKVDVHRIDPDDFTHTLL